MKEVKNEREQKERARLRGGEGKLERKGERAMITINDPAWRVHFML